MESVEKRFVWDDFQEKIVPLSGVEQKDEKARKKRRKLSVTHKCQAYCPHSYLILIFKDILNPSEKIKFEKYYLRKVPPSEPDVILLQDVKNLVMYLLSTPVSLEFVNFFQQPIVDRLLRALILYFQAYLEVWEAVLKKCAVLLKKRSKSGADERWRRKAHDLGVLRCLVAREYCELLLEYVKSPNESDLRLFEPLIVVGHRVIWIALRRKHFSVIEIELHRLFRSDWFNTADRQSAYEMSKGLREDELEILHGRKSRQRKLLQNSPLCRQLLREFCDFRAGSIDFESKDPRIKYLENALLASEENLSELDVTVGILGQFRENFNIMLAPIDDEKIMMGKSPVETLTTSESSL